MKEMGAQRRIGKAGAEQNALNTNGRDEHLDRVGDGVARELYGEVGKTSKQRQNPGDVADLSLTQDRLQLGER